MLITCRHDKRDGNFGEQRRPSAPREILGYVESEPVRCGGKGVGCGNVGQSAIVSLLWCASDREFGEIALLNELDVIHSKITESID